MHLLVIQFKIKIFQIRFMQFLTNNRIWHTCITWHGTELRAPWGWHNSVETCSSGIIICQLIVHLLVIVQNKKKKFTSFFENRLKEDSTLLTGQCKTTAIQIYYRPRGMHESEDPGISRRSSYESGDISTLLMALKLSTLSCWTLKPRDILKVKNASV
jgi:hypothetical protein